MRVLLGRRIRILESSKKSTTLYDFYTNDMKEDELTTQADRNLVGKFNDVRTLRASVPDDTERYRRILQNVIEHGGLYKKAEGQVDKMKMIKHPLHGPTRFDLLCQRVLLAA